MGLPKPRNLIIGIVIALLVVAGGLLIALPEKEASQLVSELHANGVSERHLPPDDISRDPAPPPPPLRTDQQDHAF